MAHDSAYYQAEKIIEEALKSGATELDLSNMKLTELPDSIGYLSHLLKLSLGNPIIFTLDGESESDNETDSNSTEQVKDYERGPNRLTGLPKSFGKLTQLKKLNISDNPWTVLPEQIRNLKSLEVLEISSAQLTEMPEWFEKLKQLHGLDASNNDFVTLPESLKGLSQLRFLYLSNNQLTTLPEWFKQHKQLQSLDLSGNKFSTLPEWFGQFEQLQYLDLSFTGLHKFPNFLRKLKKLHSLFLGGNQILQIPEWINDLSSLITLSLGSYVSDARYDLLMARTKLFGIGFPKDVIFHQRPSKYYNNFNEGSSNGISDIPLTILDLKHLLIINFDNNPLNPELAKAYEQGFGAVKAYLHAKATGEIILNEVKLVLVGEGEVGKTCLMDALLGNDWQEHSSTHGIEIQQFNVFTAWREKMITLNAWDFGGQRVYRPTHQLFFSAPAVYLVVWKPREGSQAGQVKEWIQLVKRREPSAKILVVATHGGPQQRQPDIDCQELWDLFGEETVVDFLSVDSKPDTQGNRKGIEELKHAIAQVAASLPEVGRSVPKSFADVRQALQDKGVPYLPLREVLDICRAHNMDDEVARLFITISHRLGHLTHYENDPTLRDIVILRPDWLATAMSYVLDDEATRTAHGLVKFSRLAQLWDDKNRAADSRYPDSLHPIFLRLMERFDLSYRVADLTARRGESPTRPYIEDPISLIGQLVPDIRPQNISDAWKTSPASGDIQQTQICHIVDASNGQSASAEGLFYQLIVRLHKYSLGRADYNASVHWQRGLVLDDDYNGLALLEHKGNDVHITVRAPYPVRFLAMLTEEVRYLVESFWEGLRCEVTVPCLNPQPCIGLFEVSKLMENIKRGRPEQPCPVCNEWQSIDKLLHNAPAASKPVSLEILEKQLSSIENKLDTVDINVRRIRSQADKNFDDLIHLLADEAKEGPRLFSFFPVDRSKFNPKTWIREKFRLVLWCEHSRLPLPVLNNGNMKKGVYDLELERDWFKKASPYLKLLTGTLGMVLPVASSAVKLALDETAYKLIEEQLDFGKSIIDTTLGETAKISDFLGTADSINLEHGVALRSDGSTLRELHALLKAKDPSFGALVRVMNKRQEFLWVHEKFAGEY